MQGMSNKEKRILERVDDICAALHTTRAELLYALLCGIVAECVQGASMPTVEPGAPEGETRAARAEAAIRKVMRDRRRETVRRLKSATHSTKISVSDWDKALASLVKAGEMRVETERTEAGQTRKVVILRKGLE